MRAGKIFSLILVLIVTVLATAVRVLSFWLFELESASPATRLLTFAAVVALVSTAVLIPMGAVIDRAFVSLRRSIENAANSDCSIATPRMRWLRPVTRALIGVVDHFRQREKTLRAQLNDLEIRHRVSEAERRQTEAVLHALRDAVIVTDAFNEIVMVNQAAADILGFDREAALHGSIDVSIGDQRLRQLIRDACTSSDFNNARHVEIAIKEPGAGGSKPNADRLFDVTLACVENHRHEVGGVVTILHDLTREREISQMKSDFVSKASHELRTPLSSIRAYVEMLVDGEVGGPGDEKSRQEFYRIIQNETDRLGRLIDNMLNISRIEAGIVQVQREMVDVKALIRRAVDTLGPQAAEKQISLHVRVGGMTEAGRSEVNEQPAANAATRAGMKHNLPAANTELCAEGDADMLYQVILNLLSNALKYTPEGGRVTVGADATGLVDRGGRRTASGEASPGGLAADRLALSGDSVVVWVSDTGLGIPPDALPKLFDKFFRIENYKRIAKGTGLGLSLCKHIVETVHRGQIGVESKLGMGSKFWFSIPVKYAGGVINAAA